MGRSKANGELPRRTIENVVKIVEPVAKDSASQFTVSTTIQGDVNIHLHLNSLKANAAQNAARRRLDDLKSPVTGLHERVVLYLHQARNDAQSSVGDRAVIESLSPTPVKLVFSTEAAKQSVVHSDENPFTSAYIVDVQVETIRGRPALYKVLRIHEKFERPTGNEAA